MGREGGELNAGGWGSVELNALDREVSKGVQNLLLFRAFRIYNSALRSH